MNKSIIYIITICMLFGCSLNPGMQDPSSSLFGGKNIYLKEKNIFIPLVDVDENVINNLMMIFHTL